MVWQYTFQSEKVFYTYIFTLCTFSYKQTTKAIEKSYQKYIPDYIL